MCIPYIATSSLQEAGESSALKQTATQRLQHPVAVTCVRFQFESHCRECKMTSFSCARSPGDGSAVYAALQRSGAQPEEGETLLQAGGCGRQDMSGAYSSALHKAHPWNKSASVPRGQAWQCPESWIPVWADKPVLKYKNRVLGTQKSHLPLPGSSAPSMTLPLAPPRGSIGKPCGWVGEPHTSGC